MCIRDSWVETSHLSPQNSSFRCKQNYCQWLKLNFAIDTKIFKFVCTALYLGVASFIYNTLRQCRHVTGTSKLMHLECINDNLCHVPVGVPLPVQILPPRPDWRTVFCSMTSLASRFNAFTSIIISYHSKINGIKHTAMQIENIY